MVRLTLWLQDLRMAKFLFTCPTTLYRVQQWLVDDDNVSDDEYEVITCPACAKVHLLNRKTGKPLGQED